MEQEELIPPILIDPEEAEEALKAYFGIGNRRKLPKTDIENALIILDNEREERLPNIPPEDLTAQEICHLIETRDEKWAKRAEQIMRDLLELETDLRMQTVTVRVKNTDSISFLKGGQGGRHHSLAQLEDERSIFGYDLPDLADDIFGF